MVNREGWWRRAERPGGYQFVGRTVPVWNHEMRGPHFTEPWLLRTFDQLQWYPVAADELLEMRQRSQPRSGP